MKELAIAAIVATLASASVGIAQQAAPAPAAATGGGAAAGGAGAGTGLGAGLGLAGGVGVATGVAVGSIVLGVAAVEGGRSDTPATATATTTN